MQIKQYCVSKFAEWITKVWKILWFLKKNSYGSYIDIAVLDQCCCVKNIAMFVDFFHEFHKMARGRNDNPSKQNYNPNGLENTVV